MRCSSAGCRNFLWWRRGNEFCVWAADGAESCNVDSRWARRLYGEEVLGA